MLLLVMAASSASVRVASASFDVIRQYNLSTGIFGVVGAIPHPLYPDVGVIAVSPCASRIASACNDSASIVLLNFTAQRVLAREYLPIGWTPAPASGTVAADGSRVFWPCTRDPRLPDHTPVLGHLLITGNPAGGFALTAQPLPEIVNRVFASSPLVATNVSLVGFYGE
jgi:hypothetical protein